MSAASQPLVSSDDEGPEPYTCRVCFESGKPSELISPCKCSGTQRYGINTIKRCHHSGN